MDECVANNKGIYQRVGRAAMLREQGNHTDENKATTTKMAV